MKSLVSLIGLAAMVVATTAYAAYDWTYPSSAKAHATTWASVEVPAGPMVVQVLPDQGAHISCSVLDQATNKVLYQSNHVAMCMAHANAKEAHVALISVTNESDEDITFKIWVHDPDTKF
jgi:hypothetical protein